MAEIPDNAPKPQDRKPKSPKKRPAAATAREAEAAGDRWIVIESSVGVTVKLPRYQSDWPIAAFKAMADSDGSERAELAITFALIGDEQYAELHKSGATGSDLIDIGREYLEALGIEPGN